LSRSGLIKDIADIVGAEYVLTDDAAMTAYSYDASRMTGKPDVVVRPRTEVEISRLLSLASRTETPVVPRGAASGLTGGAVATKGGIMLSFERMADILSVDEANREATLQPGVVTADFQAEVEKRGLFYPPDPGSRTFCTIGGNVAENAGGMRAVKYGVTRDYVTGLRAVLPTGEIIKTGVKTAKGVVGYDLTRLLIGSEGTLAVITEIDVRLLPLPETVVTMTAVFRDPAGAGRAVAELMASGVIPRCLELMDGAALMAGAERSGIAVPEGAGAFLLIETDGGKDEAHRQADVVASVVAPLALKFELAPDAARAAALWKLRRSTSQALFSLAPDKINEDVVVPVSRVTELLDGIDGIAERHGLRIVCFGHAGDGNIHVNVMTDLRDNLKRERAETAVGEVFRLVLSLDGTISGEHGVGLTKAPYLELELSRTEIELMKRVKAAFDPKGIMNPGKVFN
jgi:glycolate dehydrogenase FAD-linked subunit